MISRIWHGWTRRGNADAYQALLEREVFVGIRNRGISGFQSIQLFRRDLNEEVEFVTGDVVRFLRFSTHLRRRGV